MNAKETILFIRLFLKQLWFLIRTICVKDGSENPPDFSGDCSEQPDFVAILTKVIY
jgi:hypothetical protein